ncbi:uncharacterized protein VTP21DRAFT_4962 [Calcarisporiella thermophila]|uniref:uncharacterized protein n=1 Tax=Calcarisporiella thermophila TaxID=911321 RepID=UPI003742B8A6
MVGFALRRISPPRLNVGVARSFFGLPNLPELPNPLRQFGETSPKEHSEKKILGYSQKQLYDVVSNIDDYRLFVPWCTDSMILSTRNLNSSGNRQILHAELGIGFGALKERYVSEVTCEKYNMVMAVSKDTSLFRQLATVWRFTPNIPAASTNVTDPANFRSCQLQFHILFEFANSFYTQVSTLFHDQVSKSMVQAFEDRCREVYGPPSQIL